MTTVKTKKAGYLIDGSSSGCLCYWDSLWSFHQDIPVQWFQIYNPAWVVALEETIGFISGPPYIYFRYH